MSIQRVDKKFEDKIKALQDNFKKKGKNISFREATKIYAEFTDLKTLKVNKKKKGRGKKEGYEIVNLSDPFGLG